MKPLGEAGWAPADIKLGVAWVFGWARKDQHDAGGRYVRVHYIGAEDGATARRDLVVFR